jgi:hypothetical protein
MTNLSEVFSFIENEGAITGSQLEKEFDLTPKKARAVLGELLRRNKVRYTTVLKTNGVFWYPEDDVIKQANPFHLRESAKGTKGKDGAFTEEEIKLIEKMRAAANKPVKVSMKEADRRARGE